MKDKIGGNEDRPDVLKQGVECPNCRVPMHWFHTASFKLGDERFLAHAFQCENCYMIEQRSERDGSRYRRI